MIVSTICDEHDRKMGGGNKNDDYEKSSAAAFSRFSVIPPHFSLLHCRVAFHSRVALLAAGPSTTLPSLFERSKHVLVLC